MPLAATAGAAASSRGSQQWTPSRSSRQVSSRFNGRQRINGKPPRRSLSPWRCWRWRPSPSCRSPRGTRTGCTRSSLWRRRTPRTSERQRGKRSDFANAAELSAYLGEKLSRRGRPDRADGRRAGLSLRDLQLPDEQFPHRGLCEGDKGMGFAPFGIGLLMGLLTLTAYACCAAGDDDDRD